MTDRPISFSGPMGKMMANYTLDDVDKAVEALRQLFPDLEIARTTFGFNASVKLPGMTTAVWIAKTDWPTSGPVSVSVAPTPATIDAVAKRLRRGLTMADIRAEIARADATWAPFASAHEGYAVLLEEVDELWDEIKKKQTERDPEKLRKEAIQVAAMAVRFITSVCEDEGWKK